jgi:DNA-binding NarL/FixJ family response regulator
MRVLVFSGHENPVIVREMLEAGAHGFVEKTAGFTSSRRASRRSPRAGTYFGPKIAACCGTSSPTPRQAARRTFLTEREREILKLVAEGNSTKEIAASSGSARRPSTTTAPT